jgi:hypothetical protein
MVSHTDASRSASLALRFGVIAHSGGLRIISRIHPLA